MQIVIDIPDELYDWVNDPNKFYNTYGVSDFCDLVKNGTPLSDGHGRLIDRSKIYKAIYAEEDNCTGMGMTLEEMDAYNNGIDAMYSVIDRASTIIEADKEARISNDKNNM